MPVATRSLVHARTRQSEDDEFLETEFDILGGFSDVNPTRIPQDPKRVVRMATAQNVHSPKDFPYSLKTLPGFSKKNTNDINASDGIFTGGRWFSEISDTHIAAVSKASATSKHSIYRLDTEAEITGGANFTVGLDNLVDIVLFTDGTDAGGFFFTLLRDTVQFVNNSLARSSKTISGTTIPQFGEILSGRMVLGAPTVGGTVYDDRVYWTDERDGDLITDTATQFESFEKRLKGRIRGLRVFSDVCVVGDIHNVFFLPPNPAGTTAFGQPQEIAMGLNEGPVGHHSMIVADKKLWWRGAQGIYSLNALHEEVKNWTPHLRTSFEGFNHAKDEYTVAGVWPQEDYVVFALAGGGSSARNRLIGVNYDTGEVKLWTRTRNALWNALDASVPKLFGGGQVGAWYEEFTGTTGDADSATAVIDADIITPRHHLGFPSWVKVFAGFFVLFDPVSSEAVTVQYRLNDASAWSTHSLSPYTVTSTAGDDDTEYFPLMKTGRLLQLRFRNAISGDVLHVKGYVILWKLWRRDRTA